MSASLLRHALQFVDNDVEEVAAKTPKSKKRRGDNTSAGSRSIFEDYTQSNKRKAKKSRAAAKERPTVEQRTEANISKLLKLSAARVEPTLTEKILERATTGKPLTDKIVIDTEPVKSILFPEEEESFKDFEEEHFCS